MTRWRVACLGVMGALLALSSCVSRPKLPELPSVGGIMGPPNLTHLLPGTISSGVDVLNWIVAISFLGAFLCIVATVALGTIWGAGSATLRRLAGLFVCTGVGGMILKAFSIAIADWTARHSWIVGTIAGVVGFAVAALFAYGHRNWLEKKLNIDLDRDGDIGVEDVPQIVAAVERIDGAILLPPGPSERQS